MAAGNARSSHNGVTMASQWQQSGERCSAIRGGGRGVSRVVLHVWESTLLGDAFLLALDSLRASVFCV